MFNCFILLYKNLVVSQLQASSFSCQAQTKFVFSAYKMLLHESRVRLHTGDRCGWVIEGSHPALTRIVTSIHFTALSQKWTSHGCIMSTPRWTRRRGCEGIIGRSEGLIGKGCQRSGDLDGPSSSLSIVILLRHTVVMHTRHKITERSTANRKP